MVGPRRRVLQTKLQHLYQWTPRYKRAGEVKEAAAVYELEIQGLRCAIHHRSIYSGGSMLLQIRNAAHAWVTTMPP